jgi:hypothetical protein
MMETTKPDRTERDREPKTVHVKVHNEDDGDDYRLNAKRTETLALLITELYERKLRRARQGDDRLRCEGNGEDVFQLEALTFDAYLDQGHCPNLEWLFSAGTGGA